MNHPLTLPELLEGKTITTARMEDGLLYLHLGADEELIVLNVVACGIAELDGKTLQ